jgi:branched-chain amino acid transport system substrate-binding protein
MTHVHPLLLGPALVAGVAALTTLPARAVDDIRIAVAVPRTGTVATAGDQVVAGAQEAAKAINARGGVDGRRIVLDVEDDTCDPKQAISVANRIVGEGITLVDGHTCSAASIAASPIYAESGVVMMSPASVSAKLTDIAFAKGWTGIFRVYTRDDIQGDLMGAFMAERAKGKVVAFVHDKGTYGKGLADAVRAAFERHGGKVTFAEGINPGEKDYSAVVSKLKAVGAEVVYYGGYPPEGGLILRQAADQHYHPLFITTSGFAAPEFASIAGTAAEGTIFPFPPDPSKQPSAAGVLDAFKAANLPADGFTLFSYATVQALAEGVHRAGSTDGRKVTAALREGAPIDTVIGPLSFDKKGDALGITYDIDVWRGGKYGKME